MRSPGTVLVVDDEAKLRESVVGILQQVQIEACEAADGAAALSLLKTRPFDVVLTDLRMTGMDGMELLRQVHQQWEDQAVIMMTAHSTVPIAVEAMKNGAFDFIEKGFERDQLLAVIRRALDIANAKKRPPATAVQIQDGPWGQSPEMLAVRERLMKVADKNTTVLLLGENGTGKEVAARWIQKLSPRKEAPFIPVNCAAIPDELIEDELFGHEKGAFTNADSAKPGKFEVADKGTIFLDEIGELPLQVQATLLRVLQERTLTRIGATKEIKVDVRVIAATNRDLEKMVAEGKFRPDLYGRLNVVPVEMPPLRKRGRDVVELARQFADKLKVTNNRPRFRFLPDALELLERHSWPGNVRELHNFVERMVVLAPNDEVTRADAEKELTTSPVGNKAPAAGGTAAGALQSGVAHTEREMIVAAIKHCRGNKTLAAGMLEISRRTLYNKLKELNINDDDLR